MRRPGRILGVAVGLFGAAMSAAGCHDALKPYTPAGADVLQQPAPVPSLLREATAVVTAITFENRDNGVVIVVRTTGVPPEVRTSQGQNSRRVSLHMPVTRLDTGLAVASLQDPSGTVTRIEAVERIRRLEPLVIVNVLLNRAAHIEVEQENGTVLLSLANR